MRNLSIFGTPEAEARKRCLRHVFPLRVPSQEGESCGRSLIGDRRTRMEKKKARVDLSIYPSFGTPEGTRTPNIQNRNLTLYPIELRALINRSIIIAGLPRVVKCYFKNFFLFSNPFWNGPRHVCCLPKNVLPPRRHISLNLKFECGAAEAAFSDPFAGRTALFCVQLQKACGAM